jgi:hypothetical protein
MRDRILSVYRGERPDVVPFMLDLSHWFYHKRHLPWDLSRAYAAPETELIDYHKKMGVGFYMPNLASFFDVGYAPDVLVETGSHAIDGSPAITWRYTTPIGSIERTRIWHEQTYSWAIAGWSAKSELDIRVLQYALGRRTFAPKWENYIAWRECVGDMGVVYLPFGYSAMGQLINLWMGVEGVTYATADCPAAVREFVDVVNAGNLDCVRMLAESPAEVVILGDNFSSDTQPPRFFAEWSRAFYAEAVRILHSAGKYAAVHIDGRLRGALRMIRDTGADCADAVTPTPMGDLTPEQCRAEAGISFILSGGVSPDLWLPSASEEAFRAAVLRWLDLRKTSPRLIANAGDQVPPGAVEDRIKIMRDLVERAGC